jgi:hypothetical protein
MYYKHSKKYHKVVRNPLLFSQTEERFLSSLFLYQVFQIRVILHSLQ